MRRGQMSMEYTLILAMAFAILIPGIYFFFIYSQGSMTELASQQYQKIGEEMLASAVKVMAQGQGSSILFEANIPDGLRNISIAANGYELVLTFETEYGITEAVFFSDIPLSANDSNVLKIGSVFNGSPRQGRAEFMFEAGQNMVGIFDRFSSDHLCAPSCGCNLYTCIDSGCPDGCGGTCSGTKDCGTCTNVCSPPNEKVCLDAASYRVCEYTGDDCYEWSENWACPAGTTCQGAGLCLGCGDGQCDAQENCVTCPSDCPCSDCGDGDIDLGEECDQIDFGGNQCGTVGFAFGTLHCTDECVFDTSLCSHCNYAFVDGPKDGTCSGITNTWFMLNWVPSSQFYSETDIQVIRVSTNKTQVEQGCPNEEQCIVNNDSMQQDISKYFVSNLEPNTLYWGWVALICKDPNTSRYWNDTLPWSCMTLPYSCTGGDPANTIFCAGSDQGLTSSVTRTAVDSCDDLLTKCIYECLPGYQLVNGICVLITVGCGGDKESCCAVEPLCDPGVQQCVGDPIGMFTCTCAYCCEDSTGTCGYVPEVGYCQGTDPVGKNYDPDCNVAICGNGVVDEGEECDPGLLTCLSPAVCGLPEYSEACTCVMCVKDHVCYPSCGKDDPDCEAGYCGDGTVQVPNGNGQNEQCDGSVAPCAMFMDACGNSGTTEQCTCIRCRLDGVCYTSCVSDPDCENGD